MGRRAKTLRIFSAITAILTSHSVFGFESFKKQSGSYLLSCDNREEGAYYSCTVSVGLLGSNGKIAIFLIWVLNDQDNISFQICNAFAKITWFILPVISTNDKAILVKPLDKTEDCTVTEANLYLTILSAFWNNEFLNMSYQTSDLGPQIAHGIRTAGFREMLEESFARTGNANDLQNFLQIMPR